MARVGTLLQMNTILCVRWGDKYDHTYVEKLKEQCEAKCSVPFNFYCLTDNPTQPYDIQLPTYLDSFYDEDRGFFWAWRKCYMFNDDLVKGDKFLFLDLDIVIHQDLKYFFDLPMQKPWIVRGWWNNIDTVKLNYARLKSTPLNSSVIRWNKNQLIPVIKHIKEYSEVIFFTYPSLDNYLNHHWYNVWDEGEGFFRGFPKGDIYSWFKGNVYPDDMSSKKVRADHMICLFNNSGFEEGENDEKWIHIYS